MPRNFLAELERRVLIFDSSMCATLQTLELTADDFGGPRYERCMDALCLTRPAANAMHLNNSTVGRASSPGQLAQPACCPRRTIQRSRTFNSSASSTFSKN